MPSRSLISIAGNVQPYKNKPNVFHLTDSPTHQGEQATLQKHVTWARQVQQTPHHSLYFAISWTRCTAPLARIAGLTKCASKVTLQLYDISHK
jgi:hypothetical protein